MWALTVLNLLKSGKIGFIENKTLGGSTRGVKIKTGHRLKLLGDFVDRGSVVLVEMADKHESLYKLRQVPQVNGALIALDPHTGRVLAMTGGWSFEASELIEQPKHLDKSSSAFKPFVYLAALDEVIALLQEYLMRHS